MQNTTKAKALGMVQIREWLPSKCEALSSKSQYCHEKENKGKGIQDTKHLHRTIPQGEK
jgi:hypothetical protein